MTGTATTESSIETARDLAIQRQGDLRRCATATANKLPLRLRSRPLSEGIVGAGSAFFHQVCEMGLEGVVAKRLDSCYRRPRAIGPRPAARPPTGRFTL